MGLNAAQLAQLQQLRALKATAALTDTQALIAWLNSPAGAQQGLALAKTAQAGFDATEGAYKALANFVNVLSLTAGNLSTELVAVQAQASLALTAVQAVASVSLTIGVAASVTPVTAAGGAGVLTYALSGPALPTGLAFNAATGLLSGSATEIVNETTYTVTASDQSTPTVQTVAKTFVLIVAAA